MKKCPTIWYKQCIFKSHQNFAIFSLELVFRPNHNTKKVIFGWSKFHKTIFIKKWWSYFAQFVLPQCILSTTSSKFSGFRKHRILCMYKQGSIFNSAASYPLPRVGVIAVGTGICNANVFLWILNDFRLLESYIALTIFCQISLTLSIFIDFGATYKFQCSSCAFFRLTNPSKLCTVGLSQKH